MPWLCGQTDALAVRSRSRPFELVVMYAQSLCLDTHHKNRAHIPLVHWEINGDFHPVALSFVVAETRWCSCTRVWMQANEATRQGNASEGTHQHLRS